MVIIFLFKSSEIREYFHLHFVEILIVLLVFVIY